MYNEMSWQLWIGVVQTCDMSTISKIKLQVGKSVIYIGKYQIPINEFVTRLTRRIPLVEQKLLALPEYMTSPPVFSGVRVTRSSVVCVCFVDRCLPFCPCFVWYMCCLSFFYLLILKSSHTCYNVSKCNQPNY